MSQTGITIAGWFVTLLGSYWIGFRNGRSAQMAAEALTNKNRITQAKDDFLAVSAQQRAKLDSLPKPPHYDVFFNESLPVLREAVLKLQHILPEEQWECLRNTLRKYEAYGNEKLSDWETMAEELIQTGQNAGVRLHAFFDQFSRCLK
ncbi:MAG: hypothetical protein ABSB84_11905 [Verrucomicrobiota bacterium]|jgi:hypothetical protein